MENRFGPDLLFEDERKIVEDIRLAKASSNATIYIQNIDRIVAAFDRLAPRPAPLRALVDKWRADAKELLPSPTNPQGSEGLGGLQVYTLSKCAGQLEDVLNSMERK